MQVIETCSVDAFSREGKMTGREAKLPETCLQVEEVDTLQVEEVDTLQVEEVDTLHITASPPGGLGQVWKTCMT